MVHSVFLYPREGSIDIAFVAQFLAKQPDVLLDPVGSGIYMVCGAAAAKKVFRKRRLEDPSRFHYAVLVTVKPEYVNVFQEYGDEARLRSARNIVRWMIEHNRCRIEDEYGKDWTERVTADGVGVLYPPQLT